MHMYLHKHTKNTEQHFPLSLHYFTFNVECDAGSLVLKYVPLEQGLPKS